MELFWTVPNHLPVERRHSQRCDDVFKGMTKPSRLYCCVFKWNQQKRNRSFLSQLYTITCIYLYIIHHWGRFLSKFQQERFGCRLQDTLFTRLFAKKKKKAQKTLTRVVLSVDRMLEHLFFPSVVLLLQTLRSIFHARNVSFGFYDVISSIFRFFFIMIEFHIRKSIFYNKNVHGINTQPIKP